LSSIPDAWRSAAPSATTVPPPQVCHHLARIGTDLPAIDGAPAHAAESTAMEQRVSLVTLGVRDLARARAFYEVLGWVSPCAADSDVVFFQAGGLVLALWDRAALAADSGVDDGGGYGGVTLAYNVRSPAEVDVVVAAAGEAGARIARAPGATFWGGYSGVFVDPDGHPWEVAHNPEWHVAEDGSVHLERPAAAGPE
jgi:catechol 2,3-dioxygenase-like lactoylglutathione lyase family enzyme